MFNLVLILLLVLCVVVFYILVCKQQEQTSLILALEKDKIRLQSENDFLQEKQALIKQQTEQSQRDLKHYFENYTNEILKNKTESLQEETKVNINHVIQPLREKLDEFKKRVEETYQSESREIFSLKNEISKLLANNISMIKETENLTMALKGNVKAQGIWGELILEKILESSGLRKGIEYITQGTELGLKNEDNKLLRPDVIVNLPDNKHLIVDAKVSLTHYEQYIQDSSAQDSLPLFIKSIQQHINNLSNKNYQYHEQLITPDFVMLFFPIEGAFSLALQTMPDLLMQAWHRKIIIVSPTTLFATLKTVASIWLFEKQNKNAMQIATEAGSLYDKLVAFTEDLTKIGQAITKADEAYHHAVNKFSAGRGNIIAKTERIKELGAKAKKQLATQWQNNEVMAGHTNDDGNDNINNIDSDDVFALDKRELPDD